MATHRLAVLLAVLVLGGCEAERVNTMSFASMREAREAGAVDRGWVPAVLPDGVYEMRAAYEPAGTRRWGLFNFRVGDEAALRAVLEPEETSLKGMRIQIPGRIEWWPLALRGDLDAEALTITGLKAYRLRGSGLIVAVNWSQGRAYYWTPAV